MRLKYYIFLAGLMVLVLAQQSPPPNKSSPSNSTNSTSSHSSPSPACPPTYFQQNQTCYPCAAGCSHCTGSSRNECISCSFGFASDKNSFCQLTCKFGFYVDNIISQCENCMSSCQNGCTEASNYCNPCSSVNGVPTYYLPSTGTCVEICPTYLFATDSSGYRCVPLQTTGCLQGLLSGVCTRCMSWLSIDRKTGTCGTNCIEGCITCDNSNTCVKCASGWTMDDQGQCSCPFSNCFQCGETACVSCKEGFYMTENNTCVPLKENCIYNEDYNGCLVCRKGFYYNGSECAACPPRCGWCNSTQCTSCQSGYELDGAGRCHLIPNNPAWIVGIVVGLISGSLLMVILCGLCLSPRECTDPCGKVRKLFKMKRKVKEYEIRTLKPESDQKGSFSEIQLREPDQNLLNKSNRRDVQSEKEEIRSPEFPRQLEREALSLNGDSQNARLPLMDILRDYVQRQNSKDIPSP